MAVIDGPVNLVNNSSAFSMAEIEAQNKVVIAFQNKVRRLLKMNAGRFTDGKDGAVVRGPRIEKPLQQSITAKSKKYYGEIDEVRFQFERHGVFLQKGVGKGYKMDGGAVVRTAKGLLEGYPRIPDDWFNGPLAKHLPELADKVAEINANAAINFDRAKIK